MQVDIRQAVLGPAVDVDPGRESAATYFWMTVTNMVELRLLGNLQKGLDGLTTQTGRKTVPSDDRLGCKSQCCSEGPFS